MGKTREFFKKTGDTKGTFLVRMGMIKDRNGKDLTEAEEIKKKWQEYTELYQKNYTNDLSSVQFSRSVVSDSLRPHESQHARPPCPSPTPGVHSDSGPSSQ